MEQSEKGSSGRVGMRWGVFGGVVAFLVSLLGPLAGMVAANLPFRPQRYDIIEVVRMAR